MTNEQKYLENTYNYINEKIDEIENIIMANNLWDEDQPDYLETESLGVEDNEICLVLECDGGRNRIALYWEPESPYITLYVEVEHEVGCKDIKINDYDLYDHLVSYAEENI